MRNGKVFHGLLILGGNQRILPLVMTCHYARYMRAALLFIVGVAVLLHAAIPVGFMPDIGKQAGSFVTICSGFGEKTVFIVDDTGGHEQGMGETCTYAFTLPALDHAPVILPAIVAASYVPSTSSFSAVPVHNGNLDLSHPPTGPPVTV